MSFDDGGDDKNC